MTQECACFICPYQASINSQQFWTIFLCVSVHSDNWQDANLCSRVNLELRLCDCIREKKEAMLRPFIVANTRAQPACFQTRYRVACIAEMLVQNLP